MTTLTQTRATEVEPTRRFGLRVRRRHVWLVPGLAIALVANAQAGQHNLGLVPLLVFGIVPHLTVVLGVGQPHAQGQLAPRAVPLFNAMHQPVLPLSVLGLAAASVLPPFWFVGALAWLSHVAVDWALGDGPRTADGFLRASFPNAPARRLRSGLFRRYVAGPRDPRQGGHPETSTPPMN